MPSDTGLSAEGRGRLASALSGVLTEHRLVGLTAWETTCSCGNLSGGKVFFEHLLDMLTEATQDLIAEAVAAAVDEERERLAQAIEAARSAHWQRHLAEHPLSDGASCPRDYGAHDAYAHAVYVARGVST